MTSWNEQVIAEFRANHGRAGGMFEGSPLILLTTTGAKSGQPRTNPVRYLVAGDRLLVAASYLGAPSHPAWYHNLCADPRASVEIGSDGDIATYEATAVVTTGNERDLLYERFASEIPAFAEYQNKTARIIPVVALYPRPAK